MALYQDVSISFVGFVRLLVVFFFTIIHVLVSNLHALFPISRILYIVKLYFKVSIDIEHIHIYIYIHMCNCNIIIFLYINYCKLLKVCLFSLYRDH